MSQYPKHETKPLNTPFDCSVSLDDVNMIVRWESPKRPSVPFTVYGKFDDALHKMKQYMSAIQRVLALVPTDYAPNASLNDINEIEWVKTVTAPNGEVEDVSFAVRIHEQIDRGTVTKCTGPQGGIIPVARGDLWVVRDGEQSTLNGIRMLARCSARGCGRVIWMSPQTMHLRRRGGKGHRYMCTEHL